MLTSFLEFNLVKNYLLEFSFLYNPGYNHLSNSNKKCYVS